MNQEDLYAVNPVAMHALIVVDECDDDIQEALEIAATMVSFSTDRDLRHWLQVYAALKGERGQC